VFRFALVSDDGDSLGAVAFARRDFKPGNTIPQGAAENLRVVQVLDPEADGQLPVLVVEPAD
jgi:hypothetical protein